MTQTAQHLIGINYCTKDLFNAFREDFLFPQNWIFGSKLNLLPRTLHYLGDVTLRWALNISLPGI